MTVIFFYNIEIGFGMRKVTWGHYKGNGNGRELPALEMTIIRDQFSGFGSLKRYFILIFAYTRQKWCLCISVQEQNISWSRPRTIPVLQTIDRILFHFQFWFQGRYAAMSVSQSILRLQWSLGHLWYNNNCPPFFLVFFSSCKIRQF